MFPPLPDEQAALLRAVIADPDDDTPRLVYADWLQESGDDEQAAFIRDSVRLERLDDREDDLRQSLGQRLEEISERSGTGWVANLGITGGAPVFERGLVTGLVYDCLDQFLEDVPRLSVRAPVRAITIGDVSLHERDGLTVLSELPELARLRELRLENRWEPVSSDGWERLVTSPRVGHLEVLTLRNAVLTDENMLPLTTGEHLNNLEELGLSGNHLTPTGALTVLRSQRLPKLARLGLAYNQIYEDRRRGSAFLALRDALIERFDNLWALTVVI